MTNSPRSHSAGAPRPRRLALALVGLAIVATAVLALALPAGAQVVSRRGPSAADGPISTFVGGNLMYAAPQRDFKNYVDGALGIGGHLVHSFDESGIVALRVDAGYLVYGSTTNRQALGGGALGLISVDVTTSNNIVFGAMGLQLMAPTGKFRPYVTGSAGFSYFFTESTVEGTSSAQPFANSQNYDDGGFTMLWGGGVYVPIRSRGPNPISLDIGAQMHTNNDVQYLTKNSITFANSSTPPTIRPVRSAADFVSFRIGVSVGVR